MRPDAAEASDQQKSILDQGLRGFRETVADAESLGGAAAAANRSAHEVYDAVPGDHPPRVSEIGLPPAEPHFAPPQRRRTSRAKRAAADEQATPLEHADAPPPSSSHFERDERIYARPARS